jgi:hypothetical protein
MHLTSVPAATRSNTHTHTHTHAGQPQLENNA